MTQRMATLLHWAAGALVNCTAPPSAVGVYMYSVTNTALICLLYWALSYEVDAAL